MNSPFFPGRPSLSWGFALLLTSGSLACNDDDQRAACWGDTLEVDSTLSVEEIEDLLADQGVDSPEDLPCTTFCIRAAELELDYDYITLDEWGDPECLLESQDDPGDSLEGPLDVSCFVYGQDAC